MSTLKNPEISAATTPPPPVENARVLGVAPLVSPAELKARLPLSPALAHSVLAVRETARNILSGADSRLMVIVGPCSIHDPVAALEYARRLSELAPKVAERFFLVMRVYFEKPRTTTGWKGLINDPDLDDSCDVAKGIALARELLLEIVALGLPAATEFLDPIIPQYIADCITWAAIGARTTEAQTHREMASGLSMPVGFKNGTDGDVQVALDAMLSARTPHSFLGIDRNGITSIVKTTGNPDTHVVLRGGRNGPNYDAETVRSTIVRLQKCGLPTGLMIDCSHANSGKNPARQPDVWRDLLQQRAAGTHEIVGAMLESHLHAGSQPLKNGPGSLTYGVSITDACIDWETTERLLLES
jgi:3-deoxy-7-phosphoheptulonate synthase